MKLFLTSRKPGEIEKRPSLANLTCRSPSVHTKPTVQGKDNKQCIAMEINFHNPEKKHIYTYFSWCHTRNPSSRLTSLSPPSEVFETSSGHSVRFDFVTFEVFDGSKSLNHNGGCPLDDPTVLGSSRHEQSSFTHLWHISIDLCCHFRFHPPEVLLRQQ